MKKKNGLTEKQRKFRNEYYKNPYICMELFNNSSSTNVSFLGYSSNGTGGFPAPPQYLTVFVVICCDNTTTNVVPIYKVKVDISANIFWCLIIYMLFNILAE